MSEDFSDIGLPNPIEPPKIKQRYGIAFKGTLETKNGMTFKINSTISVTAFSYREAKEIITAQLPSLVALSMESGVKLIKFNLL